MSHAEENSGSFLRKIVAQLNQQYVTWSKSYLLLKLQVAKWQWARALASWVQEQASLRETDLFLVYARGLTGKEKPFCVVLKYDAAKSGILW